MTTAIYPGSFDPVTYGHIDIAIRASKIFDKLIIGVLVNPDKKYLFNMDERIALIKEALKEYKNIEVVGFKGLLVNYMKENNIKVIVKGLRTFSDFEYEFNMADLNKRLYNEAETTFIMTSPQYSVVSSSMVKNLAKFSGDISDFAPKYVAEAISHKFNNKGM